MHIYIVHLTSGEEKKTLTHTATPPEPEPRQRQSPLGAHYFMVHAMTWQKFFVSGDDGTGSSPPPVGWWAAIYILHFPIYTHTQTHSISYAHAVAIGTGTRTEITMVRSMAVNVLVDT